MRKKEIFIFFLVLFPFIFAEFNTTSVGIDIPTAQLLKKGNFFIAYSGSKGLEKINEWPDDYCYEDNANIRFGLLDNLEIGLTVYTRKDYTLNFTFAPIMKEKFALALGVHNIGLKGDICEKGSGLEKSFYDDYYYNKDAGLKPSENFSAFICGTTAPIKFLKINLGIGRGKFVGYGPHCKYLNTDYFFGKDEKHNWAIGLFGGLELQFGILRMILEGDGRDINIGTKINIKNLELACALTKFEAILFEDKLERISFAIGYNFPLIKEKIPVPVVEKFYKVIGKVFDSETKEPLVANVKMGTKEITTDNNGLFEFDNVATGDYTIMVKRDGYEKQEKIVKVVEGDVSLEIALKKKVIPEFKVIYFDFDKSEIREDMKDELEYNLLILKENPNLNVVIEGHACEIGGEKYNYDLSLKRAEAVYNYFLNAGIDKNRMEIKGYGEKKPVTTVRKEYYKNRRVEIVIKK
ncbi:MAG: OmpA family protein [candidate division WOR-3 bacterium]